MRAEHPFAECAEETAVLCDDCQAKVEGYAAEQADIINRTGA